VFPRNSVPAAKIALLGVDQGWGARFVQRALRANFGEDRDIASPEVQDSLLAELDLDGPAIRAEATSPARNAMLRRSTEEAVRLRIFGAPTFLVDGEMFWGNDRLERALAWATAGALGSGAAPG
jgi:2-hydroxychromene-2-carboxylate isomerase